MNSHSLLSVLVLLLATGTLATAVWALVVLSGRPAYRSTFVSPSLVRYARAS